MLDEIESKTVQKSFGGNLWGGIVGHVGTNDQVMPKEELDKCIFQ